MPSARSAKSAQGAKKKPGPKPLAGSSRRGRKGGGQRLPRQPTDEKTTAAIEAQKKAAASGPMTAVKQANRDTLMMTLRVQGWTDSEIAEEFGLTASAVHKAIKKKREAMPDLLDLDPVEIIRSLVEGFQASVADFEKMAYNYADDHPSAAVGAKRAADEARRNLAGLLQTTGTLPHDLGQVRHLVEVRVAVIEIVDSIKSFREVVASTKLPAQSKRAIEGAAEEVTETLHRVAGLEPAKNGTGG